MDDVNELASQPPAEQPIGLVAAPMGQESTSVRFFFWVERDRVVEKTQLVCVTCQIGDQEITWYGAVEEVYRRSRKRSMDEEVDLFDGDLSYTPPFGPEGLTFADVKVLRTEPPLLTPPREQHLVMLGNQADAAVAWGYAEMVDSLTGVDWGLPIGLIRNGGQHTVGVAKLDLRQLNGDLAGHLNVTGQAGRGTKSSFLTVIVRALVDTARKLDDGNASRPPFSVRPIVFNVKGNDLMYIDLPNRHLSDAHREQWQQMGVDARPFEQAEFHSPCQTGTGPVNRGAPRVVRQVDGPRQTRAYYWTLEDVVRFGLWEYLFSDNVQHSEPMMALVGHMLGNIAEPCEQSLAHPAGLKMKQGQPVRSFRDLRDEMRAALRDSQHSYRDGGIHTFGTVRALMSRLSLVLSDEGRSIFAASDPGRGEPLRVIADGTTDPLVIDIATLPHELRRFVVAAVLDQVKRHQMGSRRTRGQVYFLVLDELGIYAPRGGRDPITRLFEQVAAQLRSQGIILLGAQQQASAVSEAIFGNSQIKVIGASSPVEIESPTWNRLLSSPQKSRALMLQPEEKMVLLDRGWMNVVVPFPAWAMKESEVDVSAPAGPAEVGANGSRDRNTFELNLPEE